MHHTVGRGHTMQKKPIASAILIIAGVLLFLGADWLFLPAWNLGDLGFWFFLSFFSLPVLIGIFTLLPIEKPAVKAFLLPLLFMVVGIVLSVGSWLIWPGNDLAYQKILSVETRENGMLQNDFPTSDLLLPQIDKSLSISLAQGKLGNYGAQFQINTDIFTSLTVQRENGVRMVRVSPLDYNDFFVAMGAASSGAVGYIAVDQQSLDSALVEVPGGLHYTPNAAFGNMLLRHVRSQYKSALLGTEAFEIDDAGKPWWVIPVLQNTVGLFGGPKPVGVIVVDAVSGNMAYHERGQEPAWIDRTVPSWVAIEHANAALSLGNGWMNRDFGSKTNVFQLSDGYTYLSLKGEHAGTWLVSGITSPNEADQTLVGFMAINLKTMQALRYNIAGITEMRAMSIASSDERVRAQNLEATWPILVEVDGRPAYSLMLKNEVQRQRFVFVDVGDGRQVAMGESLEAARRQFASMAVQGSNPAGDVALLETKGTVLRVRIEAPNALFLMEGHGKVIYEANLDSFLGVRFMQPGDKVSIGYRESSASPDRRYVQKLENTSLNAGLLP